MSLRQRWCFLFLLVFGTVFIVSTYNQLSLTADEGFHAICGLEWWRLGIYTREPMHPPLTRIMTTAPLFLYELWTNTNLIKSVYADNRDAYMWFLQIIRFGTLPFYIISCVTVFAWSRHLFGAGAALWSLAFYVTTPTVSAHAGLAATDMGYAAMLVLCLYLFTRWLHEPSTRSSVAVGLAAGLTLSAKFSALTHLPTAALCILAGSALQQILQKQPINLITSRHIRQGLLYALPCSILPLLLLLHFSFETLMEGFRQIYDKNINGHAVWMFGPLGNNGVWYFFPVLFLFKSTLPFHALNITAHAQMMRRPLRIEIFFPLLAAAGVVVSSMPSNINLGVRHILPVYPLLCIPIGYAAMRLWEQKGWKRACASALMIWQAASFLSSHPDRISYFNELAGPNPEYISLDSDYEWGQGFISLSKFLRERNITQWTLCPRKLNVVSVSLRALMDFAPNPCNAGATGWIAVSRAERMLRQNDFTWLNNHNAVQTIGNIFDLYYIAPP